MDARRAHAAQRFQETVDIIIGNATPLPQILARGLDACALADWPEEHEWFLSELNGYDPAGNLPSYRRGIHGEVSVETWNEPGRLQGPHTRYVDSMLGRRDPAEIEPPEPIASNCLIPIERVLVAAREGVREPLTGWEALPLPFGTVHRRRIATYHPTWFENIRRAVEVQALQICQRGAITLTYGDAVQGIWEAYRADVDEAIARLGLDQHFAAIRDSVQKNNPEAWRQAMYSCR